MKDSAFNFNIDDGESHLGGFIKKWCDYWYADGRKLVTDRSVYNESNIAVSLLENHWFNAQYKPSNVVFYKVVFHNKDVGWGLKRDFVKSPRKGDV
jgi:hypothetical protein